MAVSPTAMASCTNTLGSSLMGSSSPSKAVAIKNMGLASWLLRGTAPSEVLSRGRMLHPNQSFRFLSVPAPSSGEPSVLGGAVGGRSEMSHSN